MGSGRHAFYYGERAKGGIGLIVCDSAFIFIIQAVAYFSKACFAYDPKVIPGLKMVQMPFTNTEPRFLLSWCIRGCHGGRWRL